MKLINTLIILILLGQLITFSQIEQGGIPYGLKFNFKNIPIYEIQDFNISEINYLKEQKKLQKDKTLLFAYNNEVFINTKNNGRWYKIDGKYVWIINVQSVSAYELSIILENYKLKSGESIFIYNSKDIIGSLNDNNNRKSGILTTRYISGGDAYIEFSTPYDTTNCGTFTITTISQTFENLKFLTIDECNVNISCPEGNSWKNEKRSVAKLTINKSSGTVLCSGTLLNNTLQDARPLLITANHCIENNYNAERTVFYFNYESMYCDSDVAYPSYTLNGGTVLSTKYENDYTLIELDYHPPISFKPYYSGWTTETGSNMNIVTAIHHPNGQVKKISGSNSHPLSDTFAEEGDPPYAQNGYWRIPEYLYGITDYGSSGCGLFDQNHLLVGTLTGGDSSDPDCKKDLNDFYEKFAVSYNVVPAYGQKMAEILNPDNQPINSLDGYEPFEDITTNCDTTTNIHKSDIINIVPYDYGNGYYCGHNSDSIALFVEKFDNNDSIHLYGLLLDVKKTGTNGHINIIVYTGNDIPEEKIYEKTIALSKLKANQDNYIELYPEIKINKNFFVGFQLDYNLSDSFCAGMAKPRNINSIYIYKNQWTSLNSYTQGNWGSSLNLKIMKCTELKNDSKQMVSISQYIFPNPNSGYFYIKTEKNITNAQIFDILGKNIKFTIQKRIDRYVINIDNNHKGIYILKIQFDDNSLVTYKIIKYK